MNLWFDSFVFGMANSLHCACMCGPLALLLHGGAVPALSYHAGRTIAYGTVGIGLGGLGAALGARELGAPTATVAFVLAFGLIILVLFGDRGLLKIPVVERLVPRLTAKTRAMSPFARAGLLGLVTPLLPCGLLWSTFAGAGVAGSWLGGLAVMTGFAVGSLPLLFVAQQSAGRFAARFGPRAVKNLQRVAMLLAAGALLWRGFANLGGGSCCH
ncbi:MAG: sulfite exporter TauE/SafE family protein [Planctomycetes bacterium]|nr:sulfite exporter TauE/SafE family protein [Planctomycetota bacterium]